MRERLTTAGEIVGAGMVTAGCTMLSIPLGLIAGGATVIAVSFLAAEAIPERLADPADDPRSPR